MSFLCGIEHCIRVLLHGVVLCVREFKVKVVSQLRGVVSARGGEGKKSKDRCWAGEDMESEVSAGEGGDSGQGGGELMK